MDTDEKKLVSDYAFRVILDHRAEARHLDTLGLASFALSVSTLGVGIPVIFARLNDLLWAFLATGALFLLLALFLTIVGFWIALRGGVALAERLMVWDAVRRAWGTDVNAFVYGGLEIQPDAQAASTKHHSKFKRLFLDVLQHGMPRFLDVVAARIYPLVAQACFLTAALIGSARVLRRYLL